MRTPDSASENLPDYAFAPHYTEITDAIAARTLRVHYVDEGSRNADLVLLMHGEPSWSFLYRKIVPALVAKGYRVVAPDLIGFGRSDKPNEQCYYTYERHVKWMSAWLPKRSVSTDITLFCQDWGGLIGLRLVAAYPERFARVVIANTGLPTGAGATPAFEQLAALSQSVPELPVGRIVNMGTQRELSTRRAGRAYLAPYPEEHFKAGARRFPALVPITPEHPSVAENKAALESTRGVSTSRFSDRVLAMAIR